MKKIKFWSTLTLSFVTLSLTIPFVVSCSKNTNNEKTNNQEPNNTPPSNTNTNLESFDKWLSGNNVTSVNSIEEANDLLLAKWKTLNNEYDLSYFVTKALNYYVQYYSIGWAPLINYNENNEVEIFQIDKFERYQDWTLDTEDNIEYRSIFNLNPIVIFNQNYSNSYNFSFSFTYQNQTKLPSDNDVRSEFSYTLSLVDNVCRGVKPVLAKYYNRSTNKTVYVPAIDLMLSKNAKQVMEYSQFKTDENTPINEEFRKNREGKSDDYFNLESEWFYILPELDYIFEIN